MGVYKNGNTIVKIEEDGTKYRYSPDNEPAKPEFPESMDIKITNRCQMMCPQCHECSTPDGKHGNLNHPILDSLMPMTEIAIGGGDPLSHPDLVPFLHRMKERGVISNITVHIRTFLDYFDTLRCWTKEGLIHGLGVSVNEVQTPNVYDKMAQFPNLVVHTILGVAGPYVYQTLAPYHFKLLILGYKRFGRGEDYYFDGMMGQRNKVDFSWMKENLVWVMDKFRVVSFDNRAIQQLDLKNVLGEDVFSRLYMGDDGEFTMYLDLTQNEYAVSSTSRRHPIDSNDIRDLFARVREWGIADERSGVVYDNV